MRTKGFRGLKGIKRKASNILLVMVLLAIVVGIAYNIYNSMAEDIISFTAQAVDSYGYLENEDFELGAKLTSDDLYEIELPKLVNEKKVNSVYKVYLETEQIIENMENVEQEEIENTNTELETPEETETESQDEPETTEEPGNTDTELETPENTNTEPETTNDTEISTETEQTVETQRQELEITDNKILLNQEQFENGKLIIELNYDIAVLEESGQKQLLADKTEEERNTLVTEEATLYYNQVLNYKNATGGKTVEVSGYLPLGTQLQVQEVSKDSIEEILGDNKLTIAYDINLLTAEGEEVKPEEFGEQCRVTIKNSKIKENSMVIHIKEDNTTEQVAVTSNESGIITFETVNFSIYAVIPPAETAIIDEAGMDAELKVEFSQNGNKEWKQGHSTTVTVKAPTLTASQITGKDYGGYVTNYNPTNGANVGWRIFHSDGENIYLIADDYVGVEYIPAGRTGNTLVPQEGKEYELADKILDAIDHSYYKEDADGNGKVDELENSSIANKLLKQYMEATTSTQIYWGQVATAYLLDTTAWGGFEDDTYAEYAIGAPTIELFRDSYNGTERLNKMLTIVEEERYIIRATSESGYWPTMQLYPDDKEMREKLYSTEDESKVRAMLIAAPTRSQGVSKVNGIFDIDGEYYISVKGVAANSDKVIESCGSRPIISLKANAQLEKQADGTYLLVGLGEYVNETNVGINKNTLKYVWRSVKDGTPTASQITETLLTSETTVVTEETTERTIEIKTPLSKNGVNGEWKLWVYVEDTLGNSKIVSSESFYFDNTGPTIAFAPNGNTTSLREQTTTVTVEEPKTISASEITAEDYGGRIATGSTRYWPSNGDTTTKWRIFHSDGENIYLIAESSVSKIPNGKGNTAPNLTITNTATSFDLAPYIDYTGVSDISIEVAEKWLKKQYAVVMDRESGMSTVGLKKSAYLLDTTKWSGYEDYSGIDFAKYAIGAPTLELFVESYNKTHEDRKIEVASTEYGYGWSWEDVNNGNPYGTTGLDDYDGLYVNGAMWLASQSSLYGNSVAFITSDGAISIAQDGSLPTRPVVCLHSHVGVRKLSDGTYELVKTDEGKAGINKETLKYVWRKETDSAPTDISEFTDTLIINETTETTIGTTSKTVEIKTPLTQGELDGNWKLWAYAEDAAGNKTITSSSTFSFDNSIPTINIESTENANGTVKIIIDFSENVTGFTIDDIEITNAEQKRNLVKYLLQGTL